ncbi:calcium-binding protein [Aestuariicoccus sp. MJ-SS9]|uniref:calcium-binding protein n=1 Tax=Aestuariicoccus sp. MJ-SS9 TaxID=3079855 RepID=UPI002906CBCB|nr:calcium-binding protein [Aestuariicoccus sp. MJ-SS9]MDU8910580.1 calcium-binding protein [Aestuariicoccus sp. MJ-SS9]
MDDFSADSSTTGTVTVGGSATGTIEEAYDRDWFAVSLETGFAYSIELSGADGGGGTLPDPYLELYDPDGIFVAWSDDFANLDSRLVYSPPTAGTYFIDAAEYGDGTGTYTVSVENLGADLPASILTTATLPLDTPVTGSFFQGYDSDWFEVSLEAGQVYLLSVESLSDEVLEGYFDLYDENGAYAYASGYYYTDGNGVMGFTVGADGTYYVEIANDFYFAFDDDSPNVGAYELLLTEGGPDIPFGPDSDVELPLDTPVSSDFYAEGDSDGFAVTLEAGEVYALTVEADADQTIDLDLEMYDENGNFTDFWGYLYGDGTATDYLQVDEDGTYFINLYNYFGSYDYTVTLTEVELPPDVGDTTDTAGTLTFDEPVLGRFEFDNDDDWYAVALEEGVSYQATATQEGTGYWGPSWNEPSLRVLDASGAVVEGTSSGFEEVRTDVFTAPSTGTYYVSVAVGNVSNWADDFDPDYALSIQSGTPVNETGTEGDDTLIGGLAPDTLDGAGGNDAIQAGDGDDTVLGGTGDDNISASGGDDYVDAGAGGDLVGGGAGHDTILAGSGADEVVAGQGNDLLIGADGVDSLWGGAGRDLILGGADGDFIGAGQGRDAIYAGLGNDEVGGGNNADLLVLGAGDDTGYGGRGSDTISGGTGDDLIKGGSGDDLIEGGSGDDTMTGGYGEDTFLFAELVEGEVDVITDYQGGEDPDDYYYYYAPATDLIVFDLEGDGEDIDPLAAFDSLSIADGETGAEVVIGGHTIILEGVAAADLSLGDFLFV